jgi:hypothetical protein
VDNLVEEGNLGFRPERETSGYHLVKDNAQGVQVGRWPNLGRLASDETGLFRGGVFYRQSSLPGGRAADRTGDAEIGQHGMNLFPLRVLPEQDVAGLDVQVEDTRLMGSIQGFPNLLEHFHGLGEGNPPATRQPIGQGTPGHVLHRKVPAARFRVFHDVIAGSSTQRGRQNFDDMGVV